MKKTLSAIFTLITALSFLLLPVNVFAADGIVTRRACVIAAPEENQIVSCDYIGMKNAFLRNGFTTTFYQQPTTGLLGMVHNKLNMVFSDADEDDVNYLYITAHGNVFGSLYIDGMGSTVMLSMSQLRSWLDGYEGHFVLLLDACHCGTAIERGEEWSSEQMAEAMLSSFLGDERSGDFLNPKYTVFCACRGDESSYMHQIFNYSYATYAYARAFGYNIRTEASGAWAGDSNGDGIETAKEIYEYADSIVPIHTIGEPQHVCYYSESGCYSVLYENYALGDVNQDHNLNSTDVTWLREYLLNTRVLTAAQKQLADMNADGTLTMADVTLLRQLIGE